MLKLLRTSRSKTSLNKSSDISNEQISINESSSENEFQNDSIIEEYSEKNDNGAKINIAYNHERVDRFKNEIRRNVLILLTQNSFNEQNGDKSLELSYVENIFNYEIHENSSNCFTNEEEQSQSFDISNGDETNGNVIVQNGNNTSYRTSSNMIENIEACSALIQILLKHEFESTKQKELDNEADKMLQLYTKFRLNNEEPFVSYAKWIAYTEVCQFCSFDPDKFLNLLDDLICQSKDSTKKKSLIKIKIPFKKKKSSKKSLTSIAFTLNFPKNFKNEEALANLFWESTRKLLNYFLNYFHDLHYICENCDANSKSSENLEKIFKIIAKIQSLNDMDEKIFQQHVKDTLNHGAIEHMIKNINLKILNNSSQNIQRLDELIRILKFTKNHMKNFDKKFGHIFEAFFKSSFPQFLYPTYDDQMVRLIQPVILQISDMSKEKFKSFNKDDEDVLIKVFELYREINNFLIFVTWDFKIQEPKLNEFTDWFLSGIDSWREASMMTALFRIEKSIEVDKLMPEFDNTKYSTSVIDTMQILYSTKNFWENLQWFDKHKDADLVKEITLDLCRATTSYLEKFMEKVQNSNGNAEDDIYKITEKLSLIIANHNYGLEKIRNLLDEFVKNKNTDRVEIEDRFHETEVNLSNKIKQLIILNLKPVNAKIETVLAGDAKASKLSDTKTYDSLIAYVEDVLSTLYRDLPIHEFEIVKSTLFLEILKNISKLVKKATKKKKPIEYFVTLNQNFDILKEIFNYSVNDEKEANHEVFEKMEQIGNLLSSFNFSTMQLIHRYYIQRYQMQQNSQNYSQNPFGTLTVRCSFNSNKLNIEIINAKGLVGGMMNRKCDSYVKLYIIPDKSFSTCQNFKTKIHNNNNSPIYDEKVEFTLSEEQMSIKDATIYFNVKEKHLMGGKGCIAEAFLTFEDIPKQDENDNLELITLSLTRLQNDELEILKVIQYKSQTGDKEAKEFLTKINRLPTTP